MMSLERFEDLAEIYGGDIARWPEGEREAARALLSAEAARLGPVLAAAAQRKRVNDDEANGIAQLKKDGMQVIEKPDGESFRKAVAPAFAEFAKEFGADAKFMSAAQVRATKAGWATPRCITARASSTSPTSSCV